MAEAPRRVSVEKQIPAERIIRYAMQEVEHLGADERLTKAVFALGEAFTFVADYVDGERRSAGDEGGGDTGERAWGDLSDIERRAALAVLCTFAEGCRNDPGAMHRAVGLAVRAAIRELGGDPDHWRETQQQ